MAYLKITPPSSAVVAQAVQVLDEALRTAYANWRAGGRAAKEPALGLAHFAGLLAIHQLNTHNPYSPQDHRATIWSYRLAANAIGRLVRAGRWERSLGRGKTHAEVHQYNPKEEA